MVENKVNVGTRLSGKVCDVRVFNDGWYLEVSLLSLCSVIKSSGKNKSGFLRRKPNHIHMKYDRLLHGWWDTSRPWCDWRELSNFLGGAESYTLVPACLNMHSRRWEGGPTCGYGKLTAGVCVFVHGYRRLLGRWTSLLVLTCLALYPFRCREVVVMATRAGGCPGYRWYYV